MENEQKIKVALIRGNSLNEWEGKLWEDVDQEIDVTAFCSKKNMFDISRLTYPIKKIRSSSDSFFTRGYYFYTKAIVQKMFGLEKKLSRFNIAHTAELSYFLTNQAVRAKKKNKNLKVVTTVWDNSFGRFEYNYWPGLSIPPKYWRTRVNNLIQENVKAVDMFLPVSEYSAEMIKDLGVPDKKIRVLVPGVHRADGTNNTSIDIHKELEKKGINSTGKNIYLSINRLVKEKGLYDLIYAWKIFSRTSDAKKNVLIIVGNGPEKQNIKRLIYQFHLEHSIVCIDFLPNHALSELYACAKALVLASIPTSLWQEQFGYVLAEAITNECPIISTYSGDIPNVVGDAGLLVPPANPPALAEALRRIEDRSVYHQLKQNCKKQKENFSISRFRQQLAGVYKEVVHT